MDMMEYQPLETQYDERVIEIARVAKVVKGGRRFQFRVTVVVGDNHGKIGIGIGKANAVPDAMRKATERAHKNIQQIVLTNTTIPHEDWPDSWSCCFTQTCFCRYRCYRRRRRSRSA